VKTAEKYTHKNEGPYRIQFPVWVKTEEGLEIEIRPFKPEDVDQFKLLFETLSPESIYFRFFSPLKSPPGDMLKQFSSLDETCGIVLAALDRAEAMLGIACVIILEDRIWGEFAVLEGDPWQGKGIGAELLKHCLLGSQTARC
jgi:acetyltransferase